MQLVQFNKYNKSYMSHTGCNRRDALVPAMTGVRKMGNTREDESLAEITFALL